MARSISTIYSSTVSTLVSNFASVGITIDPTTWSTRNIMRLMCYSFAVLTAYLEKMFDVLQSDVETIAAATPAASGFWIQKKMLEFQYSATVAQNLQLINGVIQYPTIDTTLRIITACAVPKLTMPNEVLIKVAKTGTLGLAPLTNTELAAAQSYIETIGDAGIQYEVMTQYPDRIFINADIYYTGQNSVVSANVITAILSLFQNIALTNFDGAIRVSDIESTIKAVSGVNDVVFHEIKAYGYPNDYSTGVYLIKSDTMILRQWKTIAGYCDQDIEMGYTLADSLNFIAE